MTAPFSKTDLRLALPASLSFSAAESCQGAAEARVAVGRARTRSLAPTLARMLGHVAAFARRGAVLAELRAMSDHELADIGLSRGDVRRVFDPAFARDHARYR